MPVVLFMLPPADRVGLLRQDKTSARPTAVTASRGANPTANSSAHRCRIARSLPMLDARRTRPLTALNVTKETSVSIFSSIMNKIFHHAQAAPAAQSGGEAGTQ